MILFYACLYVCAWFFFPPRQVRCWMSYRDRCPTYDSFWRGKLFSEAQLFSFLLSTCQGAEWAALHSLCTSAMKSVFFFFVCFFFTDFKCFSADSQQYFSSPPPGQLGLGSSRHVNFVEILVFEVNPTGLMLLFCTIVCKGGPASWARWCTWGRCRWRTCVRRTTLALFDAFVTDHSHWTQKLTQIMFQKATSRVLGWSPKKL